jgi:hypothetical protein
MNNETIRHHQMEKQNLLDKAPAGDYRSLLQKHMALHSTDYLTPYLSLWARQEDFDPRHLFEDLNRHRSALRLRAFRGTVFVLDKELLQETIAAKQFYFTASRMGEVEKLSRRAGFDLSAFEKRIKGLLKGKRALSTAEIKKELAGEMDVSSEFFPFALRYLEFIGLLCRGTQEHIIHRTVRYALLEEWFPEVEGALPAEQAFDALVERYVGMFGPLTMEDLCWWFPVTKTMARDSLARMGERIGSITLDGRSLLVEERDLRNLQRLGARPWGEVPVVNFLPYEDHFPKAFSGREWFLPEEALGLVTKKGTIYRGQIFPSIWVNGEIAGGWELIWKDKKKSAAEIKVTGLIPRWRENRTATSLVEEKRRDLEDFVNGRIIPLMK